MRKVLFAIFLGAEEHLGEYLKNYTMKEVVDLINQDVKRLNYYVAVSS